MTTPDHREYRVAIAELRRYSQTVANKKAVADEILGLVNQSDVSATAWGVVGLRLFDNYGQLLAELRELLGSMSAGLQSAGEKFGHAADVYQQAESDHRDILGGVLGSVEGGDQHASPNNAPEGQAEHPGGAR